MLWCSLFILSILADGYTPCTLSQDPDDYQNLGNIDVQTQHKEGDGAKDVEQGELLKCCHLCCCAVEKVLEIKNKDLETMRFSNSFLTNTFLF